MANYYRVLYSVIKITHGGIVMAQNNADQEWQQLQVRIENMFAHYLRNDLRKTDDESQDIVHFSKMPEKYSQKRVDRAA
jgi:hypothetical protein